jgi:hypothetical protein
MHDGLQQRGIRTDDFDGYIDISAEQGEDENDTRSTRRNTALKQGAW